MSLVIGLTGGIGSGKSTASQWFEKKGIAVVDADIVAREIVLPGQPALKEIKETFGEWTIQNDGYLNRQALRSYIFQHVKARKQLEEITHPKIRASIIEQLNSTQSSYSILVSPLLFETEQHLLTDRTLLIDCTEAIQISRAVQRDHQSLEQIKKIIAAQMTRIEKQKRADDIVLNETSPDDLFSQLCPLHEKYLVLAHQA
ncbi:MULTISPECIES: dephospho-CoA kinase [Acinetobacter]|jgi:dephospho-CoA kinase|uniref:dephospho-CoA kinase n=1 Tax=Acinetobacter TaxID=469 RepID=UPI0018A2C6A5|nr:MULTISPECIES: dephospho-CoA kinase [Acinetobacter]MBF7691017.1 dephospho-CoA kinase [Acinetobacter pollinis]MBF7692311.1 dephospho-CoA kinase [Acinetobacter pollinis]MBF7697080.1 dephospho-CoA kinase [Acinetobacter pollinis]MBF7700132.1 dephospho-CoA kinase [Acinetobacter pollinis]WEV48714.1 dephospho-CoA kinase [Acinetobacter sp. ESL0695]